MPVSAALCVLLTRHELRAGRPVVSRARRLDAREPGGTADTPTEAVRVPTGVGMARSSACLLSALRSVTLDLRYFVFIASLSNMSEKQRKSGSATHDPMSMHPDPRVRRIGSRDRTASARAEGHAATHVRTRTTRRAMTLDGVRERRSTRHTTSHIHRMQYQLKYHNASLPPPRTGGAHGR